MACFSGPEIITSGLVLQYDMGNTDKSWRGAPVENLIAISGSDAGMVRSGTGYSYYGVNINSAVQSRWTVNNNQLTLSFEGKRDYAVGGTGGGGDGYPVGYVYFNDWSWAAAVGDGSYSWVKRSVTFTMPNPAGKTVMFDIYHMNAGNPGLSYSRNHQVEFSTYATPFVNGTRSNTQAILDLTGRNTVTATSLTYASNNTFSFNGSNNYISSSFATTAGQAVTYCGWLYSTETTATYKNFVDSVVASPMIWWNTSGQIEFDAASFTTTPVYRNQWVYVALSKPAGSSSASYYVNGVLVGTGSAYTTPAVTPTWFNRAAGQTWKGDCPVFQVYNTALTAAEIQQNFSALRGRFGI